MASLLGQCHTGVCTVTHITSQEGTRPKTSLCSQRPVESVCRGGRPGNVSFEGWCHHWRMQEL